MIGQAFKNILVGCCFWLGVLSASANGQGAVNISATDGLIVIANESVPVDSLVQQELLDLYSLETNKWPNGSLVILFDQKSKSPAKIAFYNFLDRPEREMKKIWMRVVLSGEGRSPKVIRESQALIRKVAETRGAIGYVEAEILGSELPAGIKILTRIPSDPFDEKQDV